jgi:lambda family phage portal protein
MEGLTSHIRGSLSTQRKRAWSLYRNSAWVQAGVEYLIDALIGHGVEVRPKTADRALNRQIAEAWAAWATEEADGTGRGDFHGLLALCLREMLVGADAFVRFRARDPEDGLRVPLQLELLSGDFLPESKNEIARNGNLIRQGVEMDLVGRRTAYHLYRSSPRATNPDGSPMKIETVRVPASEVLHIFRPLETNQVRGEPPLTRAILTAKELGEYVSNELRRNTVSSAITGVITRAAPGEPTALESGATGDGDGEVAASGTIDLSVGMIPVLEPGEDIRWLTPADVGPNFAEFLRAQLRLISQAIGIPYEALTGDWSQINDRTWRAADNGFRRSIGAWQWRVLVPQFLRPLWRRWIEVAVLSGAVVLPRGMTPAQVGADFFFPPLGYINPYQEAQTALIRMRAGLQPRAWALAEEGYDAEEVDAAYAAERARERSLGLVFDSDPSLVSKSGGGQPSGSAPIDPASPGPAPSPAPTGES